MEQKLLKPQGEITLQNDTIIYGKTLSVLRFNEAKFWDADTREEVVGTLVWSAPDDRPEVGDHSAEWIFTPDNVEYAPYTGYISATVNKAQNPPQIPSSMMKVDFSCEQISDVKLPDGWIWTPAEGQDTALTVGNTITVTAAYTASDSVNYENLACEPISSYDII